MAASTSSIEVEVEEGEEEEELKSNWSEAPCDLLYLIMDNLSYTSQDYIRLGSVCFSWNSILADHSRHQHSQLPLLMMPPPSSDFKVDGRFKGITMPRDRQCRGSSHGWLITVDDDDHKSFSIRLFNPFLSSSSSSLPGGGNGMEILLPSLHVFSITRPGWEEDCQCLCKAVLSGNPISNPTDYKVMAIYSGRFQLAFFKSGDKGWIDVELPDGGESGYEDVIYYQGKFLAVDWQGAVVVCDHVAGGGMSARKLIQPPKIVLDNYPRIIEQDISQKHIVDIRYIVESSRGTLLQIQRNIEIYVIEDRTISTTTVGFRVFELELVHHHPIIAEEEDGLPEDHYEWVELKSLCGDTIFLDHHSASMSTSVSYHHPRCKPNSIYYLDHFIYDKRERDDPDMGVFILEDGSFERNFMLDHNDGTSIVGIWSFYPFGYN